MGAKLTAMGAGCAAIAVALSPAISAGINGKPVFQTSKVSLKMLGSIGSFTPVTRDDQLAKAYAQAARESLQSRGFRFTPASSATNTERSLTVLVRATGEDGVLAKRAQPVNNVGIAPVAYSLGKSMGLDRFTGEDAVKTRELSPIVESLQVPGSNFAEAGQAGSLLGQYPGRGARSDRCAAHQRDAPDAGPGKDLQRRRQRLAIGDQEPRRAGRRPLQGAPTTA